MVLSCLTGDTLLRESRDTSHAACLVVAEPARADKPQSAALYARSVAVRIVGEVGTTAGSFKVPRRGLGAGVVHGHG